MRDAPPERSRLPSIPLFEPAEWFPLHGLLSAVGLLVYVVGSHALHQRRHPSAAIAWVMSIALLPEVGVPLYLLFGTRKLLKAQVRRPVQRAAVDESVAPGWAQHLTAAMGLAPAAGYRALRIHSDGAEAAEALFEVVDGARERLDVCTFILGRDAMGDAFAERLGRRARDGVAVRLIVDGVGALMGGRRDFSRLAAEGVQVLQFVPPFRSPFKWPLRGRTNLRNHRKMVVADCERLWSGGRNLASAYFEGEGGHAPWLDLSFDLEGDIAAEAAALFDADWRFASNPDRERIGMSARSAWPPPAARPPAAQMLPTGPDYADDTVHTILLTSFHRARNRILVVTPYLVPDEALLSALALAARRGVAVDIVVPAHSNHLLADIARHRPMRELANSGARLWLSPRMVHAKAVVIDEHMAMAGSVNLDSRSLFLNYELMTAFYAPRDIARFARWIETVAAGTVQYQARAPGLPRSVGEGLVLWLAFQL